MPPAGIGRLSFLGSGKLSEEASRMYAVIHTGGKQYRVAEGDRLDVERLEGDEITLRPVMLVDGESVLATPAELGAAAVTARIVGEAKGPKIKGFTYKNKSNERKHWGHRQKYSTIEITGITKG
jgi:large subunit ribosomal protein L21